MKNLFFLLMMCLTLLSVSVSALAQGDQIIIDGKNVMFTPGQTFTYKRIDKMELLEGSFCSGYDFSFSDIEYISVDAFAKVRNCSFAHANILTGYLASINGENIDWTETFFGDGMQFPSSAEDFRKTRNCRLKRVNVFLSGDFTNFDFSDFIITGSVGYNIQGAKFENAFFRGESWSTPPYFAGGIITSAMTQEQWKQTRNYKSRIYEHLSFEGTTLEGLNLSGILFRSCTLNGSVAKINLTDAVFLDCDLTKSTGLTFEQVKSTWNYKNDRMDLCQWPEHILKALEAEKNAEQPANGGEK
ncbi:MAG: hypothetical protein Q4C70_04250 [Planctomycetia bacterium]|nr:hypothetical protein [Planctomycetia bacterium]